MLDQSPADPSAFSLPGDDTGILLIYGFTGSPAEMRLLSRALHNRGWTVHAPLLSGHGILSGCWRLCIARRRC
jgi:carboxylesterase